MKAGGEKLQVRAWCLPDASIAPNSQRSSKLFNFISWYDERTVLPAVVRRRGEAPRVASRGEHGHSSVITQPVIRFCPDRECTENANVFFSGYLFSNLSDPIHFIYLSSQQIRIALVMVDIVIPQAKQ